MADRGKVDKAKTDNVLDTFSPASKYEAMLLEQGGGPGLTEEKMILVFKVLDQCVPHLGVFTEVIKMCRDELFRAVYSQQYTGSHKDEKKSQYIQRLPFFTLCKRVYDERDEVNEAITAQLEEVKKRLFDKQKQFEEASDKIDILEEEVRDLKATIVDLNHNITKKNKDFEELNHTLSDERDTRHKEEHKLNCDIEDLKEDLHDSKNESAFLHQYKSGYEDLQNAFQELSKLEEQLIPRKKKKAAIATKRAHLVSAIENSMKLEEQILTVQNASMEEYDKFLEEHKSELLEKVVDDDEPDQYQEQEMEIDSADQGLMLIQERFVKAIDEMTTELELLRSQKFSLQEQLQTLEESRPQVKEKKRKQRGSRPQTQESGLSMDIEEEDDDNPTQDPFIVQERIFSRYAAMFYYSDNNGKTFHEFKDGKYCPSCGEKTVLCPHKILKQEQSFPLPPNSTHLKVSRPKVRINLEMMDNFFRPETMGGVDTMSVSVSPMGKSIRSRVSIAYQNSPFITGVKSPASESVLSTDISAVGGVDTTHYTHSIERVWDDFKARTAVDRMVPRPLSLIRTLSVLHEFAAYLLADDDLDVKAKIGSVLDSLYSFLEDRYMKKDMAHFAAHDLLSALTEYSFSNKMIWLFAQCLMGNLDASVFRYMLLMGDLITEVEWKEVEDFKEFAAIIYPFLGEDDLDNLQMGYTSFSENKVSKTLVCEYIIYTIMKYREPRFIETENKLLNNHHTDNNYMSEAEFIEASDAVLGVVNDTLRRRLFREAFEYVSKNDGSNEGVSILRLAQITSYLNLLLVMPVIKETVNAKIIEEREHRDELHSINGKPAHTKFAHEVPSQYELMTWSRAKTLSQNIARRERCRKERLATDNF